MHLLGWTAGTGLLRASVSFMQFLTEMAASGRRVKLSCGGRFRYESNFQDGGTAIRFLVESNNEGRIE